MRNVTEIQQRLISLGYPVGSAGADGKFGNDTLDAYNHFRAAHGKGPVVKANMDELNADLYPEDAPPATVRKPSIFDNIGTILSIINLARGKQVNQEQIGGVVRALLSAAAGYFVGKGLIDANTAATIGGALATIIVAVWSVWTNRPKVIK